MAIPLTLSEGVAAVCDVANRAWAVATLTLFAVLVSVLVPGAQEQNEKQSNRLHLMEVEVLLDAYALEYEGLANELSSLHKVWCAELPRGCVCVCLPACRAVWLTLCPCTHQEIDATEDLLKFKLDKARNRSTPLAAPSHHLQPLLPPSTLSSF